MQDNVAKKIVYGCTAYNKIHMLTALFGPCLGVRYDFAMEIKTINFGDILMSHPAGRKAFLKAKAYVFKDIKTGEIVVLDFDKVKVLAPSWADEFISGIQRDYGIEVQCINTENPSVKASLKIVMEQ